MTNTETAKLMWDAYAVRAGGKTFDGKPLPTWDGLGDERQYCWAGVAEVCADRIAKLEAALNRVTDLTGCWEHEDILQVHEIARKALEGKDDPQTNL